MADLPKLVGGIGHIFSGFNTKIETGAQNTGNDGYENSQTETVFLIVFHICLACYQFFFLQRTCLPQIIIPITQMTIPDKTS